MLDFYFPDRFSQFRSGHFPFLLGQAGALGVEARRLCCRVQPGRPSWQRYVIELEPEVERQLADQVADFSPTHVIVSEKLSPRLEGLVLSSSAARFDNLADSPPARIVGWSASELPLWLGLDHPVQPAGGRSIYDVAIPDYRCRCIGLKQGEPAPPVYVVAGPDCVYHRPLSRNRFFAAVPMDGKARRFGCSFCVGPPDLRPAFSSDPVELAAKQVIKASECGASCLDNRTFVISGAALLFRLEEFFRRLLDAGLPPSRFFFGARADELLRLGEAFERLAGRLEKAGHSLNLFNIGVENFSEPENERLNKGLSAETVMACHRMLVEMETRHPEAFRFRQWGGWGFVLFTPWTTLADLKTNLRYMRRLKGFGSEGFALGSKLQILEESAIACLARKDGLIRKTFRGFVRYDSGCIFRHDQRELPWRFKHRQTEHIYRFACRLNPVVELPERDSLSRDIGRMMEKARQIGLDALDVFEIALDEVARQPRFTRAERIVELVEARLDEMRRSRSSLAGQVRQATAADKGARKFGLVLRAAMDKGAFPEKTRLLSVARDTQVSRDQLVVTLGHGRRDYTFYLLRKRKGTMGFLESRRYLLRYAGKGRPTGPMEWMGMLVLAYAEKYLPDEDAAGWEERPVAVLSEAEVRNLAFPCAGR
ncbi:MAG: hypothetical protein D6806_10620 [Deltaproteobacteria bacterium]|nr:MAG: hypothetical protein D6806_10620 [Deltaproteobacteria bacterium]